MEKKVISALQFGGTEGDIYTLTLPYGVCSTAASTAAKEVTVDSFALATGSRVLVKFSTTNTAAAPTLNVNGTGSNSIWYRGQAVGASALAQNRVYEFVYDGSYWQLIGDLDTNTETNLTIQDKTSTDTANEVYAITNLTEGGSKGHTITPTYSAVPTKKYIDDKIANLGQALRFLGTSTTAISDGSTTSSITVNGSTVTVRTGDVVLYGNFEFVWTGSAWEQFGQEGSFSVKGHNHTVVVNGTTGEASGTTTTATGTVSSTGKGAAVVTGAQSTTPVITGVTTGTDTFVKSINGGSGSLTSSDTAATGRIAYVSGITSTPASGSTTEIKTGAKASSTAQFLQSINGGGGSLTSDTNSSGGIAYLRDVTLTGAAINGTATAITGLTPTTENFVKSVNGGSGSLAAYDAASGGSVTVANGTRIPVVTSVTHTAATLGTASTSNAAPSGHKHTYDKTTGVTLTANGSTATGRVKYVESISGGNGSIRVFSDETTTTADPDSENGRFAFVESINSTGASASGTAKVGSETHTHNYVKATGVDLGSSTATDGVKYVESITEGKGSLTSDTSATNGIQYVEAQGTFSAGTTPVASASFSGTKTNALVTAATKSYLHLNAGTTPVSSAAATHTSTATGGASGSVDVVTGVKVTSTTKAVSATYANGILTLTPNDVVTGIGASGTTKVATSAHTHSYDKTTGITLTRGTAPSLSVDAVATNGYGVITDVTRGDYTPAGSITLTRGTAPSLGSATTKYLHHSHSSASGTVKYFHPTVTTTTVASGGPSATTQVVTGVTGGSTSATIKYLEHIHTGASATTKYLSATPTTTSVDSGTNSGTAVKAVTGYASFNGGTITPVTYYLAHGHTAASGNTAAALTGVSASGTATVATSISGGSLSKTTNYLHHSHTAASVTDDNKASAVTGVSNEGTINVVTSVSGGSTSATTKYLVHTHTAASVGDSDKASAVTSVSNTGTVAAITALSTANLDTTTVASNKHTHSYGSTTALTTSNSTT